MTICPTCKHSEHDPGRCPHDNCGEAEISVPHRQTEPAEMEQDPYKRGPAVDRGHPIKPKKTE